MLRLAPSVHSDAVLDGQAGGLSGRRRAARPGCADDRLRPASAGAIDQRGDDPAAQPSRRRCRDPASDRLLRRSGPPIWGERRKPWRAARQEHRRLEARARISDGLDAIIINASGCGTTVKDYGFMLRDDEGLCQTHAANISRRSPKISPNSWSEHRPAARRPRHRSHRRLSRRLLPAARPEGHVRRRKRS